MLMYGAVEWVNENPIINGMKIFNEKNKCLSYIQENEKIIKKIKTNVYYTFVSLSVIE